jgi:hypothetical protein
MQAIATAGLTLEPQVAAHADEMFGVLSDPAIYEHENAPPSRTSSPARGGDAAWRANLRSQRLLERVGSTPAPHACEPDELFMQRDL